LRIRENAPSTWRFSRQRVESSLFWRARRRERRVLDAWGLKRARHGGGLPRIAYSRKCALDVAIFDVAIFDASNITCFGALTVESSTYLARGNSSRAGHGGRLPRIAHSTHQPRTLAPNKRPPRKARNWPMKAGVQEGCRKKRRVPGQQVTANS
jgi:hypothetical protein